MHCWTCDLQLGVVCALLDLRSPVGGDVYCWTCDHQLVVVCTAVAGLTAAAGTDLASALEGECTLVNLGQYPLVVSLVLPQ